MELQVLKSNKYIFLLQIEMKSNGLLELYLVMVLQITGIKI